MDELSEKIKVISEVIGMSAEIKPLVKIAIDAICDLSGELKQPIESLRSLVVESRIKSVEQYRKAGFSKGDAILMTLSDSERLMKALDSANKNMG